MAKEKNHNLYIVAIVAIVAILASLLFSNGNQNILGQGVTSPEYTGQPKIEPGYVDCLQWSDCGPCGKCVNGKCEASALLSLFEPGCGMGGHMPR